MIPTFPEFKKLELSDKKDVEKFTSEFPPYSDFNFSNMWGWDLKGEMGFSVLNNNLIVKFTDYLNGQLFLSFLGKNMVNETAKELIAFSKKNYKTNILKLVPESVVGFLDKSEFDVISDVDSRDYVYSVKHLVNMNNWKGHSSSRGIKKFLKLHPDYVVKVCSLQEIAKDEYLDFFKKWTRAKNIKNILEFKEYQAFKRFLEIEDSNIKVVSLYKDEFLIGFTMFEICSNSYSIAHFSKTDISYNGNTNDILNWEEAKFLNVQKILFSNWQQDLGIPGLRKSKEKYKPDLFLNKFIVKSINE